MAKNFLKKIDLYGWFEHEKKDLAKDYYLYPKNRILLAFLVILLLFFLIFQIWNYLSAPIIIGFDNNLENYLRTIRTPIGIQVFYFITLLGSQYFLLSFSLFPLFWLFLKHRKKAGVVFFTSLMGTIVVLFLSKIFFGRERPYGCASSVDCFSYPSGHTAVSFYFYGMISYLFSRFLLVPKKYIFGWVLLLIFLILGIAFSRLYLGYHFFTDVVGGFLLGSIFFIITALIIDIFYRRYW